MKTKIETCPFCGELPAETVHKDLQGRTYYALRHYCEEIAISCERFEERAAIKDWNEYVRKKAEQ